MKITKKYIQNIINEELAKEAYGEGGELLSMDRKEELPSMEEIGRTLEEAAKMLVRGRVLSGLHHGGQKMGSPLYERANKLFNELLNLRDEVMLSND